MTNIIHFPTQWFRSGAKESRWRNAFYQHPLCQWPWLCACKWNQREHHNGGLLWVQANGFQMQLLVSTDLCTASFNWCGYGWLMPEFVWKTKMKHNAFISLWSVFFFPHNPLHLYNWTFKLHLHVFVTRWKEWKYTCILSYCTEYLL